VKIATLALNLVLLAFTCAVLVTDGVSTEPAYLVLTLLVLLVPVLNLAVVFRGRSSPAWRFATALCNAALLGMVCWALVDSYPHPREDGFVAYVVAVLLIPALSVAVIVRRGPRVSVGPT
jgi:hypothetical protein